MKRIGYIYEKVYSTENLNKALDNACRQKKHKRYVRRILDNRDHYIALIQDKLKNETYKLSPNIHKTIVDRSSGKIRELTIPKFYPDQIVQWAICLQLQPLFMRGMYTYSCGSVPKRGWKHGKRYIDRIYRNDPKIRYVLKMDIRKYFPHVNTEKLKELLRRKIKDAKLLRLLDAFIDNGAPGLPIGYYLSQWLANFYLEAVDHFIKQDLKVRYYIRNVDDQILIDTNKRKLHKARREIARYMRENGYGLELKDNWQVWRIHSRPLDFLGFRFYKDKTYVRGRSYFKLIRKVAKIKKRGYCNAADAKGLSSSLGWLKHLPHGRHFYLTYIKPVISKGQLSRIISRYDKHHNRR